jgi:hypothetical protein
MSLMRVGLTACGLALAGMLACADIAAALVDLNSVLLV